MLSTDSAQLYEYANNIDCLAEQNKIDRIYIIGGQRSNKSLSRRDILINVIYRKDSFIRIASKRVHDGK